MARNKQAEPAHAGEERQDDGLGQTLADKAVGALSKVLQRNKARRQAKTTRDTTEGEDLGWEPICCDVDLHTEIRRR